MCGISMQANNGKKMLSALMGLSKNINKSMKSEQRYSKRKLLLK